MTFLSPTVAKVAMKFTSAEMLMLAVFGLSVIVAISGKSIAKGMISAFFGMVLWHRRPRPDVQRQALHLRREADAERFPVHPDADRSVRCG